MFIVVSFHTHIQSFSFITLTSYVHKYAPIIMYGLRLFNVVLTRTTRFTYDVARLASEPNMCAKFEGLVLFGL